MNIRSTPAGGHRIGSLLADFQPDFDFSAPLPLPVEEFEDRLRRIRRQAVEAGHDAIIVHAGSVGWFHASNAYLRYICDWMREGVLIIPTDADKALVLLSFFTQSVLLPPAASQSSSTKSGRSARSAGNIRIAPAILSSRPPRNAPRFLAISVSPRPRSAGSVTGRR